MEAFIVRPFGIKQDVDFEKVHNELIQPALKLAGISGNTTAAIVEQGNIREDMFSKLLTADLVIADISIHNANVFYELGIRHALQDKRTFLIRCSKDEVPFDLKTDRYLSYPTENPAACLDALVKSLIATIQSDRQDSPVFYMLPKLEAQDREKFLAVPNDFGEEVEIARVSKQAGKLALLATEAEGFPWQMPAMRVIGEAQFSLKAFEAAQMTWEKIRNRYPNDREANDRLATIYQRMAETEMSTNVNTAMEMLAKSDAAITRLLENYPKLDKYKRAEIFSLMGRNAKSRWINAWKNAAENEYRVKALQSKFLTEAWEHYERGYHEDLNHFYSGINALGLLTIITSLAESLPDDWEVEYNSSDDADLALKKYKDAQKKLATVVQTSVEAERKRLQREGKKDPWLSITEADLCCLTSTRPQRVGNLYQDAIEETSDLNFDSAKRQLQVYERLNVVPENAKAALSKFKNTENIIDDNKRHYLLFTGHMIDKPGREEPRFPPEKEQAARNAIKEIVQKEKEKIDGPVFGIAGGACGGDILFHEVCGELNIPTELYLALPREKFLVESVQFAGSDWVDRFDRLYKKLPRKILSETKELPRWLQKKPDYSIWQRNNLWMLSNALICGGIQMTLIALWDGKGGDGAGGTEDMVKQAEERGSKTIRIDISKI